MYGYLALAHDNLPLQLAQSAVCGHSGTPALLRLWTFWRGPISTASLPFEAAVEETAIASLVLAELDAERTVVPLGLRCFWPNGTGRDSPPCVFPVVARGAFLVMIASSNVHPDLVLA
jgi:hypothetical protein